MTRSLGFAVVGLLALAARPCAAQVEPVVTLHGADGTTLVRVRQRAYVTVTVWTSLEDSTPPSVLVSPPAVELMPGETQLVRLRARTPCSDAWRFLVTFRPEDTPAPTVVATVVTRVTLVTRFLSKVRCAP